MRARKVKGLDPDGPLADELERIVRTRLDEVWSFMPKAADPEEVEALHDMRIAAKRLRYVLEIAGDELFGPYAPKAQKRTKELQDLLGEIHDCDVTLPRVREIAADARARDAAAARQRGGEEEDLAPRRAAGLPHAAAHRGLATYEAYLAARRELLFDRFLERWELLGRDGFRARLEYAVSERPSRKQVPATEPPPAGAPPEPAPSPSPDVHVVHEPPPEAGGAE